MGILDTLGESYILAHVIGIWADEKTNGLEWDTVILPEGSLGELPKDGTYDFNVRQSSAVPKGRIIFVNSKKLSFGDGA